MKRLALDIETTNFSGWFSPYAKEDYILTIATYDGKGKQFWNLGHSGAEQNLLHGDDLLYPFFSHSCQGHFSLLLSAKRTKNSQPAFARGS